MNTESLTNPIVMNAIDALQSGNKTAWFALFAGNTAMMDDGRPINFKQFS